MCIWLAFVVWLVGIHMTDAKASFMLSLSLRLTEETIAGGM